MARVDVMGTWGTEIFADDHADDVRADWQDGLLGGHDPVALSAQLIDQNARLDPGVEESVVFWVALAAAQHETGWLQPDVQATAVDLIDRGGDVARWAAEDSELAASRQAELARLRAKLTGPPRAPSALTRPVDHGVRFEVGDAVLLTAPSGVRAVAVVVARVPGGGTVRPVIEVLLWDDEGSLPSRRFLATAPVVHTDSEAVKPVDGPPRVRPALHTMITPTRETAFGPRLGRLLARGIPRRPSADLRDGTLTTGEAVVTYLTWPALIVHIESGEFVYERQLTRDAVQRPRRRFGFRRL